MKNPVVELHNVFVRSDRSGHIFRDLSLTVEAGESVVITGAAGSGKTSLADLLLGRRFAESGSVEVFGRLVGPGRKREIRRVRRRIGGVGGPFALVPALTVAENITLPLVIAGNRRRILRERLLNVLTEFSLLNQASEYPDRLTRVEHTLVQFARASVANQPLLIIDEPAAGLDMKTLRRVFEYLVKIALSGRSMVILTASELPRELPNTSHFEIANGTLV
jgi:cell division transport system ATP-binding protein